MKRAKFLAVPFTLLALSLYACATMNPFQYAKTPEEVAYATVGHYQVDGAAAVAAGNALHAAGQDAAALALVQADEVAAPVVKALAAALLEYRIAVATGGDTTAALAKVQAKQAAAGAAAGNLSKALEGGK